MWNVPSAFVVLELEVEQLSGTIPRVKRGAHLPMTP